MRSLVMVLVIVCGVLICNVEKVAAFPAISFPVGRKLSDFESAHKAGAIQVIDTAAMAFATGERISSIYDKPQMLSSFRLTGLLDVIGSRKKGGKVDFPFLIRGESSEPFILHKRMAQIWDFGVGLQAKESFGLEPERRGISEILERNGNIASDAGSIMTHAPISFQINFNPWPVRQMGSVSGAFRIGRGITSPFGGITSRCQRESADYYANGGQPSLPICVARLIDRGLRSSGIAVLILTSTIAALWIGGFTWLATDYLWDGKRRGYALMALSFLPLIIMATIFSLSSPA